MLNNSIAINFSPLKIQDFSFTIFRKLKLPEEEKSTFTFRVSQRDLPIEQDLAETTQYWVAFEQQDGFNDFLCNSNTNKTLTQDFINYSIIENAKKNGLLIGINYFVRYNRISNEDNTTIDKIYFINEKTTAGEQCVWAKAGILEISGEFGVYSDFEFKKVKDFKDFKLIQKLSLSLNAYGLANTNFYADRYEQLIKFAKKYYSQVFSNSAIDIGKQKELQCGSLNQKVFLFGNNEEGSIASKMKTKSPFKTITNKIKIYFVFASDEKVYIKNAYELIHKVLQNTYKLNVEYKRFEIASTDINNLLPLVDEIKASQTIDTTVKHLVFLPIKEISLTYYYECKYHFDKNNIPIQFARYQTLSSNNSYAFDGVCLQIFTKLGGIPWEMKPSNDDCLIIGLAQANVKEQLQKETKIKKHFAYSVLLNSRGVYKTLEVFSNETSKEEYLNKLQNHIEKIITEHSKNYKTIVIHTPFKVKEEELEKINLAIKNTGNDSIKFIVIRINTNNSYFGYDKNNNSLTCAESSYLQLGNNKYLVWFEGLKTNNENPSKRFSGPAYVEFHFPTNLTETEKKSFLQDIINLSGANWRGFKAKSQPISIYYCKLVTDFIKQFRIMKLEEIDFKNTQPWFL